MYGAGDVRIESVPDAQLVEPTDALVTVTRAAICGSDLWPYRSMAPSRTGRRMGHEFIGVVEAAGDRKSTRLELQSQFHLVCRLLLEKKKKNQTTQILPHTLTYRFRIDRKQILR